MLRRPHLPDPDASPDADVVIFDGACNFCRGQVQNLRRLDPGGHKLAYLSLHDTRVSERYPDLDHERLMREMVVVDGQGQRHGGADAVRYLTRQLPLLWPIAPLLHLPGSAKLWRWLYHQIAKRRYKLAGTSCEGGSCSLHSGEDPLP